jgi:hypothetical protein
MTPQVRLVATDLDGTLLQPDGTSTPRARAARAPPPAPAGSRSSWSPAGRRAA